MRPNNADRLDSSASSPANDISPTDRCDILAIGFGTTVAMWAVGYVGHMPLTRVPPVVFVSLMLICMGIGGWFVGRYTRRSLAGAVWVGLLSSAINLLILGSLLRRPHGGQLVPQVWLWLPGTFAISILLAMVGLWLARMGRPASRPRDVNWVAALAWITCAAAMLLITAGGLVTGFRAGMAVPDWPNTYGSNMFLFPFTLMTGGVFYEHAHRLLGTLVGLSTLALAVYLTSYPSTVGRRQKAIAVLVWIVGACVVVQGILGGVRVTDDSHALAVVHGFFAHAILGGLVAVAVMLSRNWQRPGRTPSIASPNSDRVLTLVLVGLILLQTMLGTLVRQLDVFLLTHVSVAVIVVLVAVGVGARAWGLHAEEAVPRRLGLAVMLVVLLQVQLGIVSIAFRTPPVNTSPTADELLASGDNLPVQPLPALITTIHQTTAAVFLGMAVVLALWTWRLREADSVGVDGTVYGKPATAPFSGETAACCAQTMGREP
jgi:cytochrome c oxidase assembly protein subunit 15